MCHSAIPQGQGNVNQQVPPVEIPSVGDLKTVARGVGCFCSFGAYACCRGASSSLMPPGVMVAAAFSRASACDRGNIRWLGAVGPVQ